jgi:hypothetical protein
MLLPLEPRWFAMPRSLEPRWLPIVLLPVEPAPLDVPEDRLPVEPLGVPEEAEVSVEDERPPDAVPGVPEDDGLVDDVLPVLPEPEPMLGEDAVPLPLLPLDDVDPEPLTEGLDDVLLELLVADLSVELSDALLLSVLLGVLLLSELDDVPELSELVELPVFDLSMLVPPVRSDDFVSAPYRSDEPEPVVIDPDEPEAPPEAPPLPVCASAAGVIASRQTIQSPMTCLPSRM